MANYYYGNITLHGSNHILSALSNSLMHMEDIIQEHYPEDGENWIPGILKKASDFDDTEPRIFYEDHEQIGDSLKIQYYGRNTPGEKFWQKFCQLFHLEAELSWADEVEEDTGEIRITGNMSASPDIENILYQVDKNR